MQKHTHKHGHTHTHTDSNEYPIVAFSKNATIIRSPQGLKEILGMREQISLTLQKNAITEVPPNSPGFYLNVFLVRKASGGWRPVIDLKSLNAHICAPHFVWVASSNRFKKFERSHLCTSFRMYYKLSAEYSAKRGLCVQDRPAGCVLSCTNPPKQQEIPQVCLRKQGLSILGTSLRSEHSPSDLLGHTVTGYLHRLGISVIPYLKDWLVHHPDRQVLLRHQAQLLETLDLVGFILNRKKSVLDLVQDIQFLGILLGLDLGEALLPESKAREVVARACNLSSLRVLSYHRVSQFMGSLNWASGLIPLGHLYLRPLQSYFHSLGLTDRFTPPRRSDPLVLASLLQQWQDLPFITSGIPIRPFQAEYTIFMDASTQGWGAHMGDSHGPGPL